MSAKEYKLSTLWKWQEAVFGLVLAAAGVIFLMMPVLAWKYITLSIAAFLCVSGLIFVVVYYIRRRANIIGYDLVKAAVLISIGVYVYLNRTTFDDNLQSKLGIIILLIGILVIQRSFDLWHFGGSFWVILIITALLCVIAGILIILNPFASGSNLLSLLIAGGLLFSGIITVLSAFLVGHRITRYIAEAEEENLYTTDYSYKPQEQEPVYTSYQDADPIPDEETAEPEEAPQVQIPQEERPMEIEIPSEQEEGSGGIRGLFGRKKS